jgi:hypothetical protein
MKFTTTMCVVACAMTASAAAVADPEAFCKFPGQACWKVKRSAEALAEAFAQPIAAPEADADPHAEAFCKFPGQACWKAKREAIALAEVVTAAQPDSEAEEYYNALAIRDAFPEPSAEAMAGKFPLTPLPVDPQKTTQTNTCRRGRGILQIPRASLLEGQARCGGILQVPRASLLEGEARG